MFENRWQKEKKALVGEQQRGSQKKIEKKKTTIFNPRFFFLKPTDCNKLQVCTKSSVGKGEERVRKRIGAKPRIPCALKRGDFSIKSKKRIG